MPPAATSKESTSSCRIARGCSGYLESDRFQFQVRDPGSLDHATLELATPWKTTSVSTGVTTKMLMSVPSQETGSIQYELGVWSFEVDWNSDTLDPTTAEGRAQIARPWQLTSKPIGLVAMWRPSAQDVVTIRERMVAAWNRVIEGKTPARVTSTGFTSDDNGLVVGGTATLRVSVENTGDSTAVDVTATSRSSLPQLHNLNFAFGNLRPGRKASKSVTVTLPATTVGEGATVVLTFSEATGHEPAELTQKLGFNKKAAFKKAKCPEGTFSRERYDKKRAKLQKALDDGSMTQDEFDTYDAELIRCLD
ncbi:MAG: hypothetical protein H6Q90_592 [Deltaproteobacteria bacterium]|nr:hypothetical protein [Deltaproteobacteria bacterium]